MFGFENDGWKPWTLFDGTPVLVPGGLQHRARAQRRHPHVSRGRPLARRPAAGCPRAGFYFDTIVRQEPIDEEKLDVEDNLEEFGPVSDAELEHFAAEAERLAARDRTGRSWPTSAARPSATSPWCRPPG